MLWWRYYPAPLSASGGAFGPFLLPCQPWPCLFASEASWILLSPSEQRVPAFLPAKLSLLQGEPASWDKHVLVKTQTLFENCHFSHPSRIKGCTLQAIPEDNMCIPRSFKDPYPSSGDRSFGAKLNKQSKLPKAESEAWIPNPKFSETNFKPQTKTLLQISYQMFANIKVSSMKSMLELDSKGLSRVRLNIAHLKILLLAILATFCERALHAVLHSLACDECSMFLQASCGRPITRREPLKSGSGRLHFGHLGRKFCPSEARRLQNSQQICSSSASVEVSRRLVQQVLSHFVACALDWESCACAQATPIGYLAEGIERLDKILVGSLLHIFVLSASKHRHGSDMAVRLNYSHTFSAAFWLFLDVGLLWIGRGGCPISRKRCPIAGGKAEGARIAESIWAGSPGKESLAGPFNEGFSYACFLLTSCFWSKCYDLCFRYQSESTLWMRCGSIK